jgi:DNA modification methylase
MCTEEIERNTSVPKERTNVEAEPEVSRSRHPYSQFEVEREVSRLGDLFKEEVLQHFAVGDQLILLVDRMGKGFRELASRFGRKRNRLNEIYCTAKIYGRPEHRDPNIPFNCYEMARKALKISKRDPMDLLNIVVREKLTTSRKVGRYFGRLERQEENAQSLAAAPARWAGQQDLINNCRNDDCRNVIPRLEDGSVKICAFDPPYGQYVKMADGHYGESGATPCECDNAKTADAMRLMQNVLGTMEPKLAPGGVILLFRPGDNVDPRQYELEDVIQRAGLVRQFELVWDKGASKLGNGIDPYSLCTERIWVIKRLNDQLVNHNGSSTREILDQTFQGSEERLHYFQKPLALCEFLIQKHSYEGELIFEPCGCTGTFSLAAHRLNRKFVYVEMNQINYTMGSQRIYQAMVKDQPQVG